MGFDTRRYTIDSAIKQLLLLELHIRDGSVYECGCAWDAHLPLIEGLAEEGIKFAKDEKEKEFFERLMHRSRDARLKLQYGLEGEGMEIEEGFNPELTVETLRREGETLARQEGKHLFRKDAMYYVVKGGKIVWSGRQEAIARSVFEERNPVGETRLGERFIHEEVKPSEYFDPESFRTVVRDEHRVVIGCKLGEWSEDEALCQRIAKRPAPCCLVGTELQKILHPFVAKGNPDHSNRYDHYKHWRTEKLKWELKAIQKLNETERRPLQKKYYEEDIKAIKKVLEGRSVRQMEDVKGKQNPPQKGNKKTTKMATAAAIETSLIPLKQKINDLRKKADYYHSIKRYDLAGGFEVAARNVESAVKTLQEMKEEVKNNPGVKGAQEENQEYKGGFLIIESSEVRVFRDEYASAPLGSIHYDPAVGCRISPSAIRGTDSMVFQYRGLQMKAKSGTQYTVTKLPEGEAEVSVIGV